MAQSFDTDGRHKIKQMTRNPHPIKRSLSRIDELDGLRGILALWVALSHIFC